MIFRTGGAGHPQEKICISRTLLWHWKCGSRKYEQVSDGLANPPSSACGHQALWAGGVLEFCPGGLQWSAGLSVPGPVSVEGAAEGSPGCGSSLQGRGGVGTVPGTLSHPETPGWCPGLGEAKQPLRGFPEAWALCNLSAF